MNHQIEAALQFHSQRSPVKGATAPAADLGTKKGSMEAEMLNLHLNLESYFVDQSPRIIQFVGSQPKEGVSTIIREYAWLMAARFGLQVLILDACQVGGVQKAFTVSATAKGGIRPCRTWFRLSPQCNG